MVDLLTITGLLGFYLIPSFIAKGRNHKEQFAIFMLNLFTGWTGAGWVAALVWSCTNNVKK